MKLQLDSASSVPIGVKRGKRTRHLRLSIDSHNQIVVSVPMRCPEKEILRFIDSHSEWLKAQLERAPRTYTLNKWLDEYPEIVASGDRLKVIIEVQNGGRPGYRFGNGGADLLLLVPDRSEAALVALVRRFAKDALTCRLAFHAKRFNLEFQKISVRDQTGRWGSCSSRGNISLNWRLILIASELQDYVLLHELAHLKEMNHSRRFWVLLDQFDPARSAHERELDRITPQIMRIGRL